MSSKDDFYINFSGITHDHALLDPHDNHEDNGQVTSNYKSSETRTTTAASKTTHQDCSTIAILRRHPMYDCLVLVKKFRNCLDGYSLEFPAGRLTTEEQFMSTDEEEDDDGERDNNKRKAGETVAGKSCGRRKLISRFLDGDDPMYQSCCANANCFENGTSCGGVSRLPLEPQNDDRGDTCELVLVPINGLLDRLKNYTRSGLAVDSRVYAFAMGLKTAERILTTNSMKELQETPI